MSDTATVTHAVGSQACKQARAYAAELASQFPELVTDINLALAVVRSFKIEIIPLKRPGRPKKEYVTKALGLYRKRKPWREIFQELGVDERYEQIKLKNAVKMRRRRYKSEFRLRNKTP